MQGFSFFSLKSLPSPAVLVTANILAALAALTAEQSVEARARGGGGMNQSCGCNTSNETASDRATGRSTEAGREGRIAEKAFVEADTDNRADDSADNDGLLIKKVMVMTLVTRVSRRGRRERNHNSRQQGQNKLAHFCTPSFASSFSKSKEEARQRKSHRCKTVAGLIAATGKKLILAQKAKAKAPFLLTIG
jgi:hypothetical protein